MSNASNASKDFDPYYQWLGIPPSEQPADHYRLLGVQRFESDVDVISNAADRQMAFVQTFKTGKHSSESQRLLNEISAAKLCLLNATRRADYDDQLRQKLAASAAPPSSAAPPAPLARPIGSASSVFGAPPVGMAMNPGAVPPSPPLVAGMAPPPGMAPAPPFVAATVARPIAPGQSAHPTAAYAPNQPGDSGQVVFEDPHAHGSSILRRRQASPWTSPAALGAIGAMALGLVVLLYAAGMFGTSDTIADNSEQETTQEATAPVAPIATPETTTETPENPTEATTEATETPATPEATPESTTRRPPRVRIGRGGNDAGTETPESGPVRVGRPAEGNLSLAALIDRPAFDSPIARDFGPAVGYRSVWPAPRHSRNLVPDLDPEKLSVEGSWTREGDSLVSSEAAPALLELPFPLLPAERKLELVVERASGDDGFAIGVPLGATETVVVFGTNGNSRSGLATVDGNPLREGNTTSRNDRDVFPIGEPRMIHITWNDDGLQAVVHAVPGGPPSIAIPIRYTGDLKLLGPSPEWPDAPAGRVFLGSIGSSFKVSKIEFFETFQQGSRPIELGYQVEDLTLSPEAVDVVSGVWKAEGDALVLTESEGRSRVQLPVKPVMNYQLKATFERLPSDASSKRIAVGLPIANSQLMLSIEGSEGTGFAIVDGGLQSINPRIDLGDGPHELAVQVRELPRNEANPRAPLRVSVIADVDRRRIADWQGDVNTVETPANWISFDPSRPWLGADAPVKFTKVWLTRINLATGEIASSPVNVHRSSIAGPGGLASNSRPGTNGSGLGAFEPRPKRPAPEAAALEVAQKQVAELYAKEMAAAKTADEKAVLAHTMLNAAKDVGDDEAAQYALLDSARKWAAEGADAEALTSSLDKLNESFVIERWPLTTSSFQTAATAAKTIKQSTALASALAPLVSEAMDEELIEVAGQLAAIGSEVTRKNPDQRKVFRELQDQTAALVEQAKAAAAALKTLEENPDDPEANTAVAKHLCFVKQDWEHGIPYLLKAKEEPLRKLAVQEQAAPEDGEGAASLADGWWDLSKLATVAKADRINYQLRARHWYLAAQSRLTGLPVKRIDRRLEEIAALNLDAGGRKGGAKNALPAGAEAGMIGRIAVRGRDVGVLVRYQPGRTFTSPNLGALLNQPAVVDVRNSVMTLDGYLRMPLAGKVTIRHFCSSASGVNTTLYIDGQIINTMGDDTGKDETITRDLPSGDHMIRWEIRGFLRYIGDAGLTFTDANDRPVTLFYSLDALKQLRANSTILELEVGQ